MPEAPMVPEVGVEMAPKGIEQRPFSPYSWRKYPRLPWLTSERACRACRNEQAMNQLLRSMERPGYLTRRDVKDDQRARRAHFTARGRTAWAKVHEILIEIEAEWGTTPG